MKIRYKLSLLHKMIIGFLLFAGISSFFINKTAFSVRYSEGQTQNDWGSIHAGDYLVNVDYSDLPEESDLIIFTEDSANEANNGSLEIFRMAMPGGSGSIETTIHLEREWRSMYAGISAGEFPVRINSVQTEGLGYISALMYPSFFCIRLLLCIY